MAYRLVKGTFELFYSGETNQHVGSKPDGDTVRFVPDNPNLLKNFSLVDSIDPRDADFKGGGAVSLRFEAIDALELHYKGSQQNDQGARAARELMLEEVGFQSVTYSGQNSTVVQTASPHPIRGYILTRSIDPYGRVVSFIFTGTANRPDGSDVFLDTTMMDKSINAKMAKTGQAYAAFYDTLPTDLRNRTTDLVNSAWEHDKGVWVNDVSMNGATTSNQSQLEMLTLWPKLFRRLTDYFRDGNQGLAGLDSWLRADITRDDILWIIPLNEKGNLHDVITITGNKISLKYWPEEMVIQPR
jgi:hypothetical protein